MSYGLEQSADRMALVEMYSYYVYASDARDYDDLDNIFFLIRCSISSVTCHS